MTEVLTYIIPFLFLGFAFYAKRMVQREDRQRVLGMNMKLLSEFRYIEKVLYSCKTYKQCRSVNRWLYNLRYRDKMKAYGTDTYIEKEYDKLHYIATDMLSTLPNK